jgi:hypothetical protein
MMMGISNMYGKACSILSGFGLKNGLESMDIDAISLSLGVSPSLFSLVL